MRDTEAQRDVFDSRKDTWLVALLTAVAIGECVAAAALVLGGPPSFLLRVVVPLALLAAAAVVSWPLFETSYTICGAELLIRCGPFRSRVRVARIDSVSPTWSALAAPALSLDRLELRLVDPSSTVLLSPAEPARFIAVLKAIHPTITTPAA